MPITIQSNINYEEVCKELNISVHELMSFIKNKDKFKHQIEDEYTMIQVIDLYLEHLKKLKSINKLSSNSLKNYTSFYHRLRYYISKNNPKMMFQEFNEQQFIDFLSSSTNTTIKSGSMNTYTAYIKSLYNVPQGLDTRSQK